MGPNTECTMSVIFEESRKNPNQKTKIRMKKILTVIAAVVVASIAAQGQGLVNFVNSAAAGSKISVNSAVGGAATGLTPAVANNFYYALFYSTSATTVAGSGSGAIIPGASLNQSYAWSDAAWTFSGDYASNSATAGRVLGNSSATSSGAVVTGLAGGAFAQFVVIGWSANLGTTLAQAQAAYNAAVLAGGVSAAGSFLGESAVSPAVQVGDGVSVPNPAIIAASGAVTGFTLGALPVVSSVPEPGTMALAGLGGLSLLAFRRNK